LNPLPPTTSVRHFGKNVGASSSAHQATDIMLLAELVKVSEAVAATRSRTSKIEQLAALIARLAPEREIEIGVSYLAGNLPQGRIGVGYKVLQELRGVSAASSATLELRAVDDALTRIAQISGAGSVAARREALVEIFANATHPEQSFLARLLIGELRQGALEGIMTDAIARAARLDTAAVRRAAMLSGDLALVARVAITEGAAGLERFHLTLFEPVQPMLAQSATDLSDALAQLGRAALELKLDGARVQLHKQGDEVRVYTRTLNDVTVAVPELVELAPLAPGAEPDSRRREPLPCVPTDARSRFRSRCAASAADSTSTAACGAAAQPLRLRLPAPGRRRPHR
jgi:DNA ligase-1